MDITTIINLAVAIVSGIATCIPLMIQLAKTVKAAVQEKNWGNLVSMVTDLIVTAEGMYDDGATRKEWVVGMVKASADSINYDIDENVVSNLIDNLCAMSKNVNTGN